MVSSVCEGGEVFFDSVDQLILIMSEDESVIAKANPDYDVWLSEPLSVRERRESFISRMAGFPECGAVSSIEEASLSERRKSNSEANCISGYYSDDDMQDWLGVDDIISIDIVVEEEIISSEILKEVEEDCVGKSPPILTNRKKKKKKTTSWWRHFTQRMIKKSQSGGNNVVSESKLSRRVRMEQNRKSVMECSAVYGGQKLKAHNGLIWTMKFSPDGQYLASGGADGVVCIWCVATVDASSISYTKLDIDDHQPKQKKKTQASSSSVVVPHKVFHIQQEPLHKFRGHSADVLDLAWSTSNHLLSSSMDKTVRLWQAGSDECLGVFHHRNYVTCVQFNPVDENYFISGSIDGKVRIWGIARRRVKDWANVRDIVTAVCYQPNGKGFVVGSVSGNCRFYEISGDELLLNADINIQGKRKSSGYRITGIQFLKNDSQRVMITSEDSKIRILDGFEVVRKYKGLTRSGCQMSASFTSSGRHIVSAGEDSRIYLWNYDDVSTIQTSKQVKSTYSCENFLSLGVSVVIPWSDSEIGNKCCCNSSHDDDRRDEAEEASSRNLDSERFSLANWFSINDGSSRTWPEEKLPPSQHHDDCQSCNANAAACGDHTNTTSTWGLVFVTANWDGTITTFHNYGLPVRI